MRAFRSFTRFALLASLATALLGARPAQAASEVEKAGARSAATQGEIAFKEKRWADAVDLFARAESLVHSPVHLLFKARAFAQLGQLVKARETYLEIIREEPAKPSPAIGKAQAAAREELPSIEPRLANVTIKVSGPGAANASVTMDGAKVPAALVGLSSPVDPGDHQFRAASGELQSEVVTLRVKEGSTGSVELVLKPLGAAQGTTEHAVLEADTGTPMGGGNGLRTASYVAFGAGAVGLALGTVFAVTAKGKFDDANALCSSFPCELTQAQSDRRDQLGKDGDGAKTLSLVGFVVGGAGVVTGTTLFILSNRKSGPESASVQPFFGLGSLGLKGKF